MIENLNDFVSWMHELIQQCEIPTGNEFLLIVKENENIREYLSLWDNIRKDTYNIVGNEIQIQWEK